MWSLLDKQKKMLGDGNIGGQNFVTIMPELEQTANLNVTPFNLFRCTANMKKLFDSCANAWVGPWCSGDVMSCVVQKGKLL